MNAHDKDELRDLREYLNRRFMWAVGILVTIAIAAAGWEFRQTQVISKTAEVAESAKEASQINTADIKQIGRDISSSNEQMSGMAAQIAAQSRTLNRIDASLSELTRYLRDRGRVQ